MTPVVKHRRLLKTVKVVLIPHARQEIEFLCFFELHAVDVEPGGTLLRDRTSNFAQPGM